jgi:hypothetical protein
MAIAVIATGLLRAALPHELRNGDAAWLFLVLVVGLLAVLIVGDPGRIDRDRRWLHNLTSVLIGLISGPSGSRTSSPSPSGTGTSTGVDLPRAPPAGRYCPP